MRNYLLFYFLFTAAVVAAAVCYCDKQVRDESERIHAVQQLNHKYTQILSQETNNMMRKMAEITKANPKYIFWSKAMQQLNRYSERIYDSDLERYDRLRKQFKTYWTDTLPSDSLFLKYANLIVLDKEREAEFSVFLTNITNYNPQEKAQFWTLDKMYWLQNINSVMTAIYTELEQDINPERAAFRPNTSIALLQMSKANLMTKDTIEAKIAIARILKTDSLCSFFINGQHIKSINGKAYFDLPVGKASPKQKTINASCNFKTKHTFADAIVAEIRYKVEK
jgi:hypothetical protein